MVMLSRVAYLRLPPTLPFHGGTGAVLGDGPVRVANGVGRPPLLTYLINLSKPPLRLRPGSWHTHCHVFGPKDLYPFAATTSHGPAHAPQGRLFALPMLGIERRVIAQSAAPGMDNRVVEEALAEKRGAFPGVALLDPNVADGERRRLDRVGSAL
jgi:2-pyrone-4,6-dicarboxylate lactonase